ncbi:hypothetical protein SLEP1_g35321 [Rubroshorea leprosula]|uniref:Uncharacterized protein n=1 Tax=Rubroshorea leprosula TaxID=152421 RepID=A0AAV5KMX5_9ROSI|nr:hypothetical protein SLEP1_g35321 [Rubroshorea leprosula]
MNLLPNVENSTENSRPKATASASNVKPSDFFSNVSGAGNLGSMEEAANRTDFRKPETTEMLRRLIEQILRKEKDKIKKPVII